MTKILKQDKNSFVAWCRERRFFFNNQSNSLVQSHCEYKPLISILTPTYKTPISLLFKTARSVIKQQYKNWQWVIVDDCSKSFALSMALKLLAIHPKITVKLQSTNQHISATTNNAAKLAKGDYLAFLDHDDELTLDALQTMCVAINKTDADFIYSDEDFIDINQHYDSAHFKTDFNLDLLFNHNYITHFSLVKKSLFDQIGGLRSECDGAQDYDFVLRVSEATNKIDHVSDILYHWRRTEFSTSAGHSHKPYTHENGRKALQDTLVNRNIKADVLDGNMPNFFYVKRALTAYPLVSIVIPFKDQPNLLREVIDSIINLTNYRNFEIIGVSNNSTEAETHQLMAYYQGDAFKEQAIQFYQHNIDFNFSALVNFGVEKAQGEHVVLMNNDIKLLDGDWLEAMLVHSQRSEVACVGAKLLYPGGAGIQHAGIAVGLGRDVDGGSAGHIHQRMASHSKGYYNRLHTIQEITAVTAALLMIKKDYYNQLHGFDEDTFGVAFNDVDFCLRARELGYKNIFTPYAEAFHFESVSRGHDDQGEKLDRLNTEKQALRDRHAAFFAGNDPFYNRQLDYNVDDFSVANKYTPYVK